MNLYPCAYSMTFNVTKEPGTGQADFECDFESALPGYSGCK